MTTIKNALDNAIGQLTSPQSPWSVTQKTINGIDYKFYDKAPSTLVALLDDGRKHGDNTFLIYQDETLTFNQFFAKADALAWQLQNQYAIQAGDKVAIAMRNYPEWMMAFVAIAQTGAVIVPLNSWGQKAELEYGLKDSGAKLVIVDQQRLDYVQDELAQLGVQAIIARAEKPLSQGVQALENLCQQAQGKQASVPDIDPESLAMIMYTAGTTGNPKGAMASHRNICQGIFNFELAAIAAAMTNGDAITKMLERGFPSKTLLAIPLFHVSGCHSVFLLSLRGGRSIYMMYKWDRVKALELIEKERITTIYAVPTMLMDLLESDEWDNYDTQSLFAFGAGGAAQPPHLVDIIYQRLPDSFPGTGYGMTESSATGFSSTGAVYRYKPKSCGAATPIVEVKIINEQGQQAKANEAGEIWLKSPGVVQGYWQKPEESAKTFKDGWLLTGDVGYLDDEGFLFITDRIKDIVIRAGENITCIDVETCALSHEAVQEAAAFGLADEKLGEKLALAVVLKTGRQLSETELQQFMKEKVAAFKVPEKIFFAASLPRNAAEKVLKKQLKATYN